MKNQKELLTAKEMELVFSRLEQQNPSPKPELLAPNPYCFLVSVVLSAQATDKSVNAATAPLYKKVKTPKQML
ncbi:MAG: endonuclease III, partial [Treponema sp.]|nr:endonuclease III [Treponema sp.]